MPPLQNKDLDRQKPEARMQQTYCITCKERDGARIEEEAGEDQKKRQENIKNIESSRSCFERAKED